MNWKRALAAVLKAVSVLILLGGPLFVFWLMASMGAVPLYVARMIPVAGIPLILVLMAVSTGYLGQKWVKGLWCAFGCVCLFCGAYIGMGVYRDSIPTVDDRSLILQDYVPFQEDNRLVTLDEEATFHLENPWSVTLDGATALYPVYAAFTQAVYANDRSYKPMESLGFSPHHSQVECNGTSSAYRRLINGDVDMIFASGPSDDQLAAAAEAGMQLYLTPIGREAFVFFVNSANPVTNLTVEEIQGIYTGEITNWKDLGGKNQKIRPYQRAENSGSQTSLQRLMAGLPLMEPEEEDRIAGMGGIITEVASYRNYKNAIGFSFRYYATEMVQNGEIRLLELNGVEPTKETIRDGSYPVASEFYAVTAGPIGAPAPQEWNGYLKGFLDWILSEQGQRIIEETGYVALR